MRSAEMALVAAGAHRCRARLRVRAQVAIATAMTLLMSAAPSSQAAEPPFGVQEKNFEAGTCTENTSGEPCSYETPEKFYTQAAGRPPFGITYFKLNATGASGSEQPIGELKRVRVDIPAGLSVNPFAVPRCPTTVFEKNASACSPETVIGEEEATVYLPLLGNATVKGTIYNLEPAEGLPAEFGVNLEPLPPVSLPGGALHVLIEGGLSWHSEPEGQPEGRGVAGGPSGDYHEYFDIRNISNTISILASKLIFEGTAGTGFITMPSSCEGPQTSYIEVESYEAELARAKTTSPVGASGCEKIAFKPEIAVTPSTIASDRPDGATVEVRVPQDENPADINSSTVKDATVTLPEGMTLNPAAADGLKACTNEQFGRGTANAVACPAGSQIGTVTIETPMLPAKTLAGNVYVGQPLSREPASGREYRILMDAEAPRYGVAVRLEGRVSANEKTGQLTTAVLEDPPLPFSDFIVKLQSGERTPLANPLSCGEARTTASLLPYSGTGAVGPFSSFPVDFDGNGAACPAPLPFSPAQTTSATPTTGGASTAFTLDLTRPEGQQYLSSVSTALPVGLIGRIPAVPLCGEPAAADGSCPAASRIGTATAEVGSGPKPYSLSGPVYLTGAYGGGPFGLSIAVNAKKVGPYDYGTIVTRAAISIDPYSARVTVASALPTIVGGVPIRLRGVRVSIDHAGLLSNPTYCGPLATDTALASTFGTLSAARTPFQASGCERLAFQPQMTLRTSARTSRRTGAALDVSITMPSGDADIREVRSTLPPQLVARDSTLKAACPAATFEANPAACPPESSVGSVSVSTPTLPDTLSGPAYFVSHGGTAFPDLDLVLQGDGVTVILVSHTSIAGTTTRSDFASVPDVPFSSFRLQLPSGPDSALSANGSLCRHPMHMAVTFVAQNGKRLERQAPIEVAGCSTHAKHHSKHRRGCPHRRHRRRRGHAHPHAHRHGHGHRRHRGHAAGRHHGHLRHRGHRHRRRRHRHRHPRACRRPHRRHRRSRHHKHRRHGRRPRR